MFEELLPLSSSDDEEIEIIEERRRKKYKITMVSMSSKRRKLGSSVQSPPQSDVGQRQRFPSSRLPVPVKEKRKITDQLRGQVEEEVGRELLSMRIEADVQRSQHSLTEDSQSPIERENSITAMRRGVTSGDREDGDEEGLNGAGPAGSEEEEKQLQNMMFNLMVKYLALTFFME